MGVHSPPRVCSERLKLLTFDLNADPDPAFHSNVDSDPDPACENNADPGGSGSIYWPTTLKTSRFLAQPTNRKSAEVEFTKVILTKIEYFCERTIHGSRILDLIVT